MTRALRPSPAPQAAWPVSHGLAREARTRLQGALRPRGTLLREGCAAPAARQGLLRGAAQLVRAAPVAATAPKWVPSPQNGQSWGPTGSAIARRAPQGPGRMGVRRPHPGALDGGPASLRHCAGGASASCVTAQGAGLRPCAVHGGRWVGGRGAQRPSRVSECAGPGPDGGPPGRPGSASPPPPLFAGSHGCHLLRSQQSPSGPAAGARAVVQPGPAPGHEETHVHAAVAEPRAFSCSPERIGR